MPRPDSRRPDQLRPLTFRRRYTRSAPGSVLVKAGRTTVLCTCCVEPKVPDFLVGKGKGWLTAEYGMLPGATTTRKPRDKGGKVDGRSVEIQRLIGRSLGAVVAAVDGVNSIKGLLTVPVTEVLTDSVAAVSVGLVDGEERLDLEYVEDRDADVDMNLVTTGDGRLIEVQGSGEEATFTRKQLDALVDLGETGIRGITQHQ